MPNLEGLTTRLVRADLEFVICGGLAALLHGASMFTRDIDIACRMDRGNVRKIFNAVADLKPVHRMTPARIPFTEEQAAQSDFENIHLSTDLGQLDCLGEVKGIGGYDECLTDSQPVDIGGTAVRILSLGATIAAKRAVGRPRDLQTAAELETIRTKLI
jgi:hypothetical protein